jgi:hypothetical protein
MPSDPSVKFTRLLFLFVVAMLLAFGGDTNAECPSQSSNLLTQVQTIPLDGVEGRIDHFGIDANGKWLFVAALRNDTVEVVDLVAGKVTKHIRNLRAPQGIGFAPESDRLAVANDQDGSCRLYDGTSLQQTATIELKDADNVRYDNVSRRLWVGYGDGGLAAIDPESGKQVADVKLDAHPESFQLETRQADLRERAKRRLRRRRRPGDRDRHREVSFERGCGELPDGVRRDQPPSVHR